VNGPPRAIYALEPWILPPVVWGGSALQARFGKRGGAADLIGESWEVRCVPGRESLVSGTRAPLAAEFAARPRHFLGASAPEGVAFPLLAKLLATSAFLSVQVHPSDEQARRLEGSACGKQEAWVVIEAAQGAEVLAGLRPGATASQLFEAAAAGDGERARSLLLSHAVAPGDVVEIPPGCVHAPGAGLVLYEAQQPVDLTYRIFDWNRVGLDGKPRPLHVERARQVLNATARPRVRKDAGAPPPEAGGIARETLVSTRPFRLERWRGSGSSRVPVTALLAVTCVAGGAALAAGAEGVTLGRGASCVVTAGAREIAVEGRSADLLVAVPS
jgi:mannose-6-phosphate isomerase